MKSQKIIFYTTEGCHLCEEAMAMLSYVLKSDPSLSKALTVQKVDISENEQLLTDYGIRIPVLKISDQELAWPFELTQLTQWVAQFNLKTSVEQ